MSGFNIFQHPPIILTLWWYVKNIGVYREQKQGYGHPLTIIMSKKMRKETKTHMEKSFLKIGHERKTKNIVDVSPN